MILCAAGATTKGEETHTCMDGQDPVQVSSWCCQADALLQRRFAGLGSQTSLLQTHLDGNVTPVSCILTLTVISYPIPRNGCTRLAHSRAVLVFFRPSARLTCTPSILAAVQ